MAKRCGFQFQDIHTFFEFPFWRRRACQARLLVGQRRMEITSTNLPMLLRFEDKNSMAHSVEARLPFLDYRVMEFSLALPTAVKIRNGWTKWILRQINQKRLPASVAWRKDKVGFAAPTQSWRVAHQQQMIRDISRSPLIRELSFVGTDWNSIAQSLGSSSLWRLYNLAIWES
ncbi:MAG: asparagine synthase C-terminal domain-containing protein [Pseudomonadota bacterium]|nr:asparagine synthase C-terminal domain-containing protein [Pseudomonadota bacterium]